MSFLFEQVARCGNTGIVVELCSHCQSLLSRGKPPAILKVLPPDPGHSGNDNGGGPWGNPVPRRADALDRFVGVFGPYRLVENVLDGSHVAGIFPQAGIALAEGLRIRRGATYVVRADSWDLLGQQKSQARAGGACRIYHLPGGDPDIPRLQQIVARLVP